MNAALDQALISRSKALGTQAAMVIEMRLDLAAIAIKRQQWERAERFLSEVESQFASQDLSVVSPDRREFAALRPIFYQQTYNFAVRAPTADPVRARLAEGKVRQLLAQQQRQLFDPVSRTWAGMPVPQSEQKSAQIRAAGERVSERLKHR
jgi:hypothetical protein